MPDSLLRAIREAQTDAARFKANLDAARWHDKYDLPHSQPYFDEMMRLADKTGDPRNQTLAWMETGYRIFRLGHADSSLFAYQKALGLARNCGMIAEESALLGNISTVQIFLRNLPEAKKYAENQLLFSRKNNLKRDEGSAHMTFGKIADIEGDLPGAIAEIQQAAIIFEKNGFRENLGDATSEIAALYDLLGQNETALEWFRKALNMASENQDLYRIADYYGNIGSQHDVLGRPDSAIFYHQKSLELSRKTANRRQEAYALNNLGVVFDLKGEREKALDFYQKSLEIKQELGDSAYFASNYLNIGAIQLDQGKYRPARHNLETALWYSEKFQRLDFQLEAWDNLRELYEKTGDCPAAMKAMKNYYSLRDSLSSPADRDSVMALQARFNFEKEARLKAERDLEKERTAEKSKRARLFGLLALAAAGLALMAFWFFFFARRKSKELALLLKEVQHRAKNNLQNVGALLTLFSREMPDEAARRALEEGRRRVDAMKILEQKLLQGPQKTGAVIEAADYLGELLENISAALPSRMPIEIRRDLQRPLEMDVEKAMAVGLIVNELVLNAVKHAVAAPAISVSFHREGKYRLVVEDSGKGMPEGFDFEKSASFGLKIVQLFAEKLRATFSKSNTPGARFEFVFD